MKKVSIISLFFFSFLHAMERSLTPPQSPYPFSIKNIKNDPTKLTELGVLFTIKEKPFNSIKKHLERLPSFSCLAALDNQNDSSIIGCVLYEIDYRGCALIHDLITKEEHNEITKTALLKALEQAILNQAILQSDTNPKGIIVQTFDQAQTAFYGQSGFQQREHNLFYKELKNSLTA